MKPYVSSHLRNSANKKQEAGKPQGEGGVKSKEATKTVGMRGQLNGRWR